MTRSASGPLLELVDQLVEVREAGAEEDPRQGIAAPRRYDVAVDHDVELAGSARGLEPGFDATGISCTRADGEVLTS